MLTEIDPAVRSQINLNAVIAAIPELVARVPAAREIALADPKQTSVSFAVRGGPRGTLAFEDGVAAFLPNRTAATIRLPFASPAAFNKVIDGEAQPIPVTGFHRIKFLLNVFAPLSALLATYLQPTDEAMADPDFRATSTILTLFVAASAAAQVANHDRSGKFSAGLMPDGDVAVEVANTLTYTLRVADHTISFLPESTPNPRAAMRFADLDTVSGVLSGRLSAIACICDGRVSMRGMINMVDNTNRILDRVGLYLA